MNPMNPWRKTPPQSDPAILRHGRALADPRHRHCLWSWQSLRLGHPNGADQSWRRDFGQVLVIQAVRRCCSQSGCVLFVCPCSRIKLISKESISQKKVQFLAINKSPSQEFEVAQTRLLQGIPIASPEKNAATMINGESTPSRMARMGLLIVGFVTL